MNLRPCLRKAVVSCLLLSTLGLPTEPVQAAPLAVSDQPLFLLGMVDPNIMLMLDSSGSMSNIVPDVPYDPDFPYLTTCPKNNLVPSSNQVWLSVVSNAPRITYQGNGSYIWGTGNGQKCFASDVNYIAKLNTNGIKDYLPAQYTGNYLNWYFNRARDPSGCANTWNNSGKKPCSKSRIEIARSASIGLIDSLATENRVGLSTYNGDTGGALLEVVDSLNSAKRTAIKSEIAALTASGSTPLAETLSDIGRYFTTGIPDTDKLALHPGSGASAETVASIFNNHSMLNSTGVRTLLPPINFFCQKSFAVLLTDGRPQSDQSISKHLCDYDGDSGGNCTNYDKKSDQTYESAGSDYLDDVANALYEMDLRPDLSDPNGKVDDKNNIATFTIGFADDQVINDPLMKDTAKNGGGLFLQAGNEQDLIEAFNTIAATIAQAKPSASALAANSTSIEVGATVYQAIFDSTDWSGDLIAYPVKSNGQVDTASPWWKAASKLTDPSTRKIFTFNPDTKTGVDYVWSALTPAQQNALNTDTAGNLDARGTDRLDWIRGVHTKEARYPPGEFRNRQRTLLNGTKQDWILGDIVNSDPVYMYANDFGYQALAGTEGTTYVQYQTDKTGPTGGKPIVFIGANDGMLHAFRADVADPSSGTELFAFVPNAVYPNLSKLSTVGYTHAYFVDGSPTVGDAYFDGTWHTVVVGGLNAGGKSVFALDVTDFATKAPGTFTPSASKTVMWEISDTDLGLTYSTPQVGRLNNGKWAAIFGNGYNSATERAYLYVVDIKTGGIIAKLPAGPMGSNGLSTPVLYDKNGDKIIDYVYAGDLQGNLWKFDLADTSALNWHVAYGSAPDFAPLFTARSPAGEVQPITAQPALGSPPTISPAPVEPGVMVYFGTGQYLQTDDVYDTVVQTFYGIWDSGSPVGGTGRSKLQQQKIVSTVSDFGATLRTTSAETVVWNSQRGWYLDFDVPTPYSGTERVVSRAVLRYDRVIFLTVIPSSKECTPGGISWLMELDAISGAKTAESSFDFNNDGKFDDKDFVGDSVVSGYQTTVGITKPPAWFTGADGKDYKVMTGTTGGIETVGNRGGPPPAPAGGLFRRTYWLQIQ